MTNAVTICLLAIQRIEGYDRLIFKWWWLGLAVVALMILLACWQAILQVVLWWQKPTFNPERLFSRLASLHQLSRQERVLIAGFTTNLKRGLPPAILFADPSSWEWSRIEDPNVIPLLEKLHLKIFGFPRDGKAD